MSETTATRPPAADTVISVVLPVYNEARVLPRLHRLVQEALGEISCRSEIVFVNDGSTDGSAGLLDQLARNHPGTRVVHLSRNFGHQAAVQAGLEYVDGDAVIVMDSDLQDDPRAFRTLVTAWRDGADVVYAVRQSRKESAWKRGLFWAFYRLLNAVSATPFPRDAGNFGLLDRRVARLVAQLPEHDRYFAGLRGWVGFEQRGVPVERLARYDDRPRVSLAGLVRLAKTALFSFSRTPLTLFYLFAAASLLVCAGCSTFCLVHKLLLGIATPGWTSTVMVASFFGAINALGIGVLGEYIVRIYDQVRGRPKFIVARETGVKLIDERRFSIDRDLQELLQHARTTQQLVASGIGRDTVELTD